MDRVEQSAESAETETLEWQINSGSNKAHVIDTAQNGWRTPSGDRKRSGPRSLCGTYPQRNADGVWFSLPVDGPGVSSALTGSKVCDNCAERLAVRTAITARCPVDRRIVQVGADGTCPRCGDVLIPPGVGDPQ